MMNLSIEMRLLRFLYIVAIISEIRLCDSILFRSRLNVQRSFQSRFNLSPLYLRSDDNRRRGDDDNQDDEKSPRSNRMSRDDFEDQNDDSFELEDEIDRKMRDRFPGSGSSNGRRNKPKPKAIVKDLNKWEVVNRAVLAGVFVAGIGSGITIDSAINTNPRDLASRDAIDKNAPNPKLCATYGSSAMVLDQRVFITFNPFNVYVTQADTKPGCVLRPSNVVSFLQKERSLITDEEVDACKNGYNTWAYIGDINNKPQLNCVFQSDDAQNEFLSNPKVGLGEDIYDDEKANLGKMLKPDQAKN